MSPLQRWKALFDGVRPDRIPCDFWGTAELTRALMADLQCPTERELWNALGVDKCIYLAPRHPFAAEDTWHIPSLFSIWNVKTVRTPYLDGRGEYEEALTGDAPLRFARVARDLDDFPWPSSQDWDYSDFRARCLDWAGHPIVAAAYEPFYLYCRLRGMDQALEDLVVNRDLVGAAMERIFDIHAGIVRRVLDQAGDLVTFLYVAEDLGTQRSLLMSPAAFRNCIKPWLKKMIDLAHSHGALVFHHDDGAIWPLLPDLAEIGVDLLNPIQWRCRGMERERLAAEYGSRFVFHGGVDNQHTLPYGTPEDVRAEVRRNIEVFRNGRGYIVAPCHNLQVNTPTANVVALYQAVREFGQT